MISHKHKCIFLHIPKCAGTSVESLLGHHELYSGISKQDHRSLRMVQKPLCRVSVLSSIENVVEIFRAVKYLFSPNIPNPLSKLTLSSKQYEAYYKFTIVRNPWARIDSWYRAVMGDPVMKDSLGLHDNCTLYEALSIHAGKGLLKSQLYWLKDFSGVVPMDCIAKFETLSDDFKSIAKALNLETDKLPHMLLSKGSGNSYQSRFDEKSRNLVSEVYAEEIEMFGYQF